MDTKTTFLPKQNPVGIFTFHQTKTQFFWWVKNSKLRRQVNFSGRKIIALEAGLKKLRTHPCSCEKVKKRKLYECPYLLNTVHNFIPAKPEFTHIKFRSDRHDRKYRHRWRHCHWTLTCEETDTIPSFSTTVSWVVFEKCPSPVAIWELLYRWKRFSMRSEFVKTVGNCK